MGYYIQADADGRARATGLHLEGATGLYFGSVALVAGVATVTTANVTAAALIFLSAITSGGTAGNLTVTAIADGVSFTITSSSNTDTRTIAWQIFN